MKQKITEKTLETFIDLMRIRNDENHLKRIPMEAEYNLLNLIRQGRYQDIKLPPYQRLQENIGKMALDDLTSYRYLAISAVALFSRTALECGVEPDWIFDYSDALLLYLSGAESLEEVHEIYQLAGVVFAKQVHYHRNKEHSYQVDKICTYISRNIFHKITIPEIAAYAELSPNYMSSLFAAEMGISIHNYIQREKVVIACNLLMHTERPVSEIAVYLGFKTQSNFSAVFRKWKNMSPSEYRDKMYREVY